MKYVSTLIAAAASLGAAATAQTLDDIRERAAFIEEYQGMLASSNSALSSAALAEGLTSKDPVIRQTAMDFALTSDNKDYRTQALASYFSTLPNLLIRMELPDEPSEGQTKLYEFWTPVQIDVREFLSDKNEFSGKTDGRKTYDFSGRIIDDGIELTSSSTSFQLRLVNKNLLTGTAQSAGTTVSVTMALQ